MCVWGGGGEGEGGVRGGGGGGGGGRAPRLPQPQPGGRTSPPRRHALLTDASFHFSTARTDVSVSWASVDPPAVLFMML